MWEAKWSCLEKFGGMTFNALETSYIFVCLFCFFSVAIWGKKRKKRESNTHEEEHPVAGISTFCRSFWIKERFLSLEVSSMKTTANFWEFSECLFLFFKQFLLKALLFIYSSRWSGFSLAKAAPGIACLIAAWCLWDSCCGAGGGWGQRGRKEYLGQKGRSDRGEKHTGLRNGERADGKTPKHWPWRIFLLNNFIPLKRRNEPRAPTLGVILDGLTLSSYFLMFTAFSNLHLTCQSTGPRGMMLKDQGSAATTWDQAWAHLGLSLTAVCGEGTFGGHSRAWAASFSKENQGN